MQILGSKEYDIGQSYNIVVLYLSLSYSEKFVFGTFYVSIHILYSEF